MDGFRVRKPVLRGTASGAFDLGGKGVFAIGRTVEHPSEGVKPKAEGRAPENMLPGSDVD